jgi:hypothetical protein
MPIDELQCERVIIDETRGHERLDLSLENILVQSAIPKTVLDLSARLAAPCESVE